MPTDYPRPKERTFAAGHFSRPLHQQLTSKLKAAGNQAGASLVTTLIASFELFLQYFTVQKQVIIGVPSAGQLSLNHPEFLGHCVNFLPIISAPNQAIPFSEYLRKRKSEILGDYEYNRITLGSLLPSIDFKRDSSRVPITPLLFNVSMQMDRNVSFYGIRHQLTSNPKQYENFEIFIDISGSDEAFTVDWSYNKKLFKPETISRMMESYEYLLNAITANPDICPAELFTDSTGVALSRYRQGPVVPYPKNKPFTAYVTEAALAFPDKIAVVFNEKTISYRVLEAQSNQLANFLIDNGVKVGDVVGIAMDRSIEMVIALLATVKAGATYVPLDPQYPTNRIEFMLNDAGAALLLTESRYANSFDTPATVLPVDQLSQKVGTYSTDAPAPLLNGEDLVYILYTSGSTGKPKGVQVKHTSFSNFLLSMQEAPGISASDAVLAITTISFDIAGLDLYLPLMVGATLLLADAETARNASSLVSLARQKKATIIQATPATWRMVLATDEQKLAVKALCGGEALQKDLAKKLLKKCDSVWNVYGPTETTVWSTLKEITPASLDRITVGTPVFNTRIYLLNDEYGRVPDGQEGQIFIAGDGVSKGYVGRPELNKEKFVKDIECPDSLMYATVDLGVINEDGELIVLGRIDHQVKIRGFRIELGEIENQILELQGIKSAVVTAREDIPGDQRLVAYVITESESMSREKITEWRKHLAANLPHYMLPNDWVCLERFPLTVNNKVDRKALPAPVADVHARARLQTGGITTQHEELIASIWQDLLKVDHVMIDDDFFDLGGHSMLAVDLMNRIEQKTGKLLQLTAIFRHPILRNFAALLADEVIEETGGLIDGKEHSSNAVTPIIQLPTIESQREIWLGSSLGGEEANKAYNVFCSITLSGKIDMDALKNSIRYLVDRHEALRATFDEEGSEIRIQDKMPFSISMENFTHLEEDKRNNRLISILDENDEQGFDLANGPLFRALVISLSDTSHQVILTAHHIICDGWSFHILAKELGAIYAAISEGRPSDLAPAPKISEYIEKKHQFYQSSAYQRTNTYWLNKYRETFPSLSLPSAFPRPLVRTYRSENCELEIERAVCEGFRHMGSSMAINLLVLLEVYLNKITGSQDIVIGLPVAGQLQETTFNQLVAHCVNTLPIRSQVNLEQTFSEYLSSRIPKILTDFEYQHFTFGSLVQQLSIHRDQSRPLIPLIYYYEPPTEEQPAFGNMRASARLRPGKYDTFDIGLVIYDLGDRLRLSWSYNAGLFTAESIRKFHAQFSQLMKAVVEQTTSPIAKLSLATPEDLICIAKWNDTAAVYDKNETLHGLFAKTAIQYPEKTAIFDGKHSLNYRELDTTSDSLAHRLIARGIQKGDIVAVSLPRSCDLVVTLMAVMKAGGVYLPIEPGLPQGRIQYMLEDAGAKHFIGSNALMPQITPSHIKFIEIGDLYRALQEPSDNDKALPPVSGSDLVYLVYTSGSTGRPKGVKVRHSGVVNFMLGKQKAPGITPEDRVLFITPIAFDMAAVLFLPLVTGASLVVADDEMAKDGRLLYQAMRDNHISWMVTTPSVWRMIIDSGWDERLDIKVQSGGEALSKELAGQLLARSTSVWNGYGPTETTIAVLMKEIKTINEPITIGRPMQNVKIYVLDNQGNPAPIGQPGEIYIGGDCVSAGYHNRPELTNKLFINDPFSDIPGALMYRSGDMGKYLPNGDIQYLGRIDQQVKIRGLRIELGEIEHELLQQEGVENVVVTVDGEVEEDKKLVAYVVGVETTKSAIETWKRQLSLHLPAYMIPSMFIGIDQIPLTANGKVDKEKLPKPDPTHQARENEETATPTTAQQKLIARIWNEVLQTTNIGLNDNFFEFGGNSIKAVKVMLMLEKAIGIRHPLTTIFQYPTIASFERFLNNDVTAGKEDSSAVPVETTVEDTQDNEHSTDTPSAIQLPMIEAQREVWLACQWGEEEASRGFALPLSVEINGYLDIELINKTIDYLINKHEALRTTFGVDGSEITVHNRMAVAVDFHDLTRTPEQELDNEARKLLDEFTAFSFDLANGPLIKFSVVQHKPEKFVINILVHHIICDGWSSEIVIADFVSCYTALLKGQMPPSYPVTTLTEYVRDVVDYYESDDYQRVEQYWLNKFKEDIPKLAIPTDLPKPDKRTYSSNRIDLEVPPSLYQTYKQYIQSMDPGSSIGVLSILEILLYRLTGSERTIIGLPVAGQLFDEKYWGLVTHCVNTLPIASEVNGEAKFIDYISKRKKEILNDFENQRFTFGSLFKHLKIDRDASRSSFLPIVFNYFAEEDTQATNTEEISHRLIDNIRTHDTFEMVVNAFAQPDGSLKLTWQYNTSLFSEKAIRGFHEKFMRLMAEIVAQPENPIDRLAFYDEEELLDQKRLWNLGYIERETNATVIGLLDRAVRKFPNHTALHFEGTKLTYSELDKKSCQLANFLIQKGVKPGDFVGISLYRSIEMVISVIGILKAGAAYMPLDVTFPKDRITAILENVGPDCLLLIQKELENNFPTDHSKFHIESVWQSLDTYACTDPGIKTDDDATIYVLHTSGSTGKPKGVCLGQASLGNLLLWQFDQSKANEHSRTLQFAPITFDVSFEDIFATLLTGGQLYIIPEEMRFDTDALLDYLDKHRINRIFLPFVALQALAESAESSNRYPKSLTEWITAGEQLIITPQIAKLCSKIAGSTLFNQYGPTETHVITQLKLEGDPTRWPHLPTIGIPIYNTRIHILNDKLRPVSKGEVGELCVSGKSLAQGYLNMPQLTMEKFATANYITDEPIRIYRTGDLARILPDGNIEFLGRMDNQVKIRGYRVELGEIESQLVSLPNVHQSIVKVQSDNRGNKRLVAYLTVALSTSKGNDAVILEPFSNELKESIKQSLREHLPDYMIPYEMVAVNRFPLTKSGKIDRKSLPPVDFSGDNVAAHVVAPSTDNERLILRIWSDTLGQEGISIHDNFFDIGGYSLLAVKIMRAIEKETGKHLPLATLFENPTIQKLALLLDGDGKEINWKSLVPIKPQGSKPPLYLVHAAGMNVLVFQTLSKYLDSELPIYGLQARGLNDVKDSHQTVEEMASTYVAEIIAHNPTGPYFIGGYSSGGTIAYEMRKQFQKLGKEVAFVGMFDSFVHKRLDDRSWNKNGPIKMALLNALYAVILLFRHPKAYLKDKYFYLRGLMISKTARLNLPYPALAHTPEHIQELQRRLEKALDMYEIVPSDQVTYLFRANAQIGYYPYFSTNGWAPYLGASVNVINIPGDHMDIFKEPSVKVMARELQRILDEIQARGHNQHEPVANDKKRTGNRPSIDNIVHNMQ